RHGQRLMRCPAQGRAALYQTNSEPLLAAVRRLPGGDRSQLSGGRHHPSGDGQSELTQSQGAGGPVRRKDRRPVVGALYGALHSEARQLAEPGGDRDQSVLPSMPGPAENPVTRTTATTSESMEREDEPGPSHHQLEVYPHKGTAEVRLQKKQIHTVRDLVRILSYGEVTE